jgi:nucleotide-binding universal stress UspA family protein
MADLFFMQRKVNHPSCRIIEEKGAMILKILVCTDGSENSKKCIEFAARMVSDCTINEVSIIYVHESAQIFPDYWHGKYPFSPEEEKQLKDLDKRIIEERKKIFADAVKHFDATNIKLETLFRIGHPAETIAEEAENGNYDLVVIGRRGSGGVKKLFMGSVSSTVLQLLKTNILIVK